MNDIYDSRNKIQIEGIMQFMEVELTLRLINNEYKKSFIVSHSFVVEFEYMAVYNNHIGIINCIFYFNHLTSLEIIIHFARRWLDQDSYFWAVPKRSTWCNEKSQFSPSLIYAEPGPASVYSSVLSPSTSRGDINFLWLWSV